MCTRVDIISSVCSRVDIICNVIVGFTIILTPYKICYFNDKINQMSWRLRIRFCGSIPCDVDYTS